MINPGYPIYLVMRDIGRSSLGKDYGYEGLCHPEKTRAMIIREIMTDHSNITNIWELADGRCIDVTKEFLEAAGVVEEPMILSAPPSVWEGERHYHLSNDRDATQSGQGSLVEDGAQ